MSPLLRFLVLGLALGIATASQDHSKSHSESSHKHYSKSHHEHEQDAHLEKAKSEDSHSSKAIESVHQGSKGEFSHKHSSHSDAHADAHKSAADSTVAAAVPVVGAHGPAIEAVPVPVAGAVGTPHWEEMKHDSGVSQFFSDFMAIKRKQSHGKCLTARGSKDFCLCQVQRANGFMCNFDCACSNGVCEASACRVTGGFVIATVLITLGIIALPALWVHYRRKNTYESSRWTAAKAARARMFARRPSSMQTPMPYGSRAPSDIMSLHPEGEEGEDISYPEAASVVTESSVSNSDVGNTNDFDGTDITVDQESEAEMNFAPPQEYLYPEATPSQEEAQVQHIAEDQAVEQEHTVAVIGGGMACIATAHELVSRNFKVVILEKNATLRGVWSKAFHSSLDVPLSQFLGWELPKSFPKCPNELEVQAYLNQYVDKFRLRHLFRFNSSVSQVVNNADGSYTIHTQLANGERKVETFDELVFSTGMFSNPLVPRNSSTGVLQNGSVPQIAAPEQQARTVPAVPYARSSSSVASGSTGTEYTEQSYEASTVVDMAPPAVADRSPAPFSLPEAVPEHMPLEQETSVYSETAYSDMHSTSSTENDAYGTFDPNYDMDETSSIAAEPFNFNMDVPEFSEPDVISQPISETSTVFRAKPPKCGIPDGNRPVYIPVAIDHPRNFHRDYADSLQLVGDHFTELMVVTMYNEHGDELARTLQGILENHENYVKSGGNWHDVVLCIVSDGVTKISESCLEFSQSFGLINQDDMEELEQPCDVHMWYSIPEVEKDSNAMASNFPPLQILYILKEKNAGKLHSHMWAFNGIAPVCQPTYCFLIDVGTVPAERAIHMLYEEMEYNPSIGGCCGEITPVISCNALHWAQSFEYKISHVLDKAFESVFGFISVLPGAFSAYRYEAIEGRPLQKYFSSFQKKLSELGAFRANMYLAEDRILCFELICQKDRTWTLHYVKNALATTDAPPTLLELLKQRRRWLNGSFFAMIYVLMHIHQFWTDGGHSFPRKFAISCEFLFYALSTFLNWFMVGSLFICVYYTVKLGMLRDYYVVVLAVLISYTFSILIQLIFALGHKPDSLEWVYQAIATCYAILMILLLYTAIDYSLIHNPNWWYRVAFLITFGGYFVAGAMHGEFSVFLSYVVYFLLLPTFLTIFTLYSFCNIDDLSWGTKNADEMNDEERRAREKFKVFRTQVLMSWLSLNICLVLILTLFDLNRPYIIALAFIGASFTGVKIIGSFCYLVEYCYTQMVRKRLVRQPKLDYGLAKGGYEPVDYDAPAFNNPFDQASAAYSQ